MIQRMQIGPKGLLMYVVSAHRFKRHLDHCLTNALARYSLDFPMNIASEPATVEKLGMLNCILQIAQMNCWSSVPVQGHAMLRMPSNRRRSKRIPSSPLRRPHQQIDIVHSVRFLGCSRSLYSKKTCRKRRIWPTRSKMVSDKNKYIFHPPEDLLT